MDNYISFIGYVSLPTDIERQQYVDTCLRLSQLTIKCEDGGVFHRVPINPLLLNQIIFPQERGQLGSCCVLLVDEKLQKPTIVSILQSSDNLSDLKEGEFKIYRNDILSHIEVRGSLQNRSLVFVVNSNNLPGLIHFVCSNLDKNSLIKFECGGTIEVIGELFVSLKSFNEILLSVEGHDSVTSLQLTDVIKLNSGDQPMIRGTEFREFLVDLLIEISNITTTTMLGQMPILNKAQILSFRERIDSFISTHCFID